MQVLGRRTRSRNHIKWYVLILSIIALIVAALLLWNYKPGVEGPDGRAKIGSTIDEDLRRLATGVLNKKLTELNGLQGQVIVMEVETGAIKAMVGLERKYDGSYRPCNNFGYWQEPGQTISTAVMLALLETGEVKLSDEVDVDNGVWALDELNTIRDHNWNRGGYGVINMEHILEVSSNVGISKMVNKVFMGKEQEFFDMLDKMSYGKPDIIEGFPPMRPSSHTSPNDSTWTRKLLLWNAFGYDRTITPIQTLTFYNAIANGGKMVKPTLREGETEVINEQIASKENISEIQKALFHVVTEGLAKPAGTHLVEVAGKMGDAQVKSLYDSQDSEATEYHVSFCGYFPAFAPQYSIIISLNKMGLPYSGGLMAGSVFHVIVEWMVQHGWMNEDNQ
ncbi:MAG: penicillin-binding protein [Bacteroidaceae bacterium]|nr:penicillin-binding protein [Bacteroidaceae bacterium]